MFLRQCNKAMLSIINYTWSDSGVLEPEVTFIVIGVSITRYVTSCSTLDSLSRCRRILLPGVEIPLVSELSLEAQIFFIRTEGI